MITSWQHAVLRNPRRSTPRTFNVHTPSPGSSPSPAGPASRSRRRGRLATVLAVLDHRARQGPLAGPDYFARLHDGSALVVDCRPTEWIKPKDAATLDTHRDACELVGWHYRPAGTTDTILATSLHWLAGYRHPRHDLAPVADALRECSPRPRR
jgi:hypothetical protein